MRYVLALCLLVGGLGVSGCEVSVGASRAPQVISEFFTVKPGSPIDRAPQVIDTVAKTVIAADPVIAVVEKATGVTVSPEVAERGESIGNKVQVGLNTASGIMRVIPGAQPYAEIVGGIGILAGVIGGMFGRRKAASAVRANSRAENSARIADARAVQRDSLQAKVNRANKLASDDLESAVANEAALKSVIMAVNDIAGVGKLIKTESLDDGTAFAVEKAYIELHSDDILSVDVPPVKA